MDFPTPDFRAPAIACPSLSDLIVRFFGLLPQYLNM